MPNEVIDHVHHTARQEKANCSLVFQNRNWDLLPDLEDNDDDESYVPSMSDGEAEYDLPDPIDDGGDHNDDDGTNTEMKGANTAE